jgi:hypothetical protein
MPGMPESGNGLIRSQCGPRTNQLDEIIHNIAAFGDLQSGRWNMRLGLAVEARSICIERSVRISRPALSDKTSRLRPRHVVSKPGQTHEPEGLVQVREWIAANAIRGSQIFDTIRRGVPRGRTCSRSRISPPGFTTLPNSCNAGICH